MIDKIILLIACFLSLKKSTVLFVRFYLVTMSYHTIAVPRRWRCLVSKKKDNIINRPNQASNSGLELSTAILNLTNKHYRTLAFRTL
jgi:hypothetical protein